MWNEWWRVNRACIVKSTYLYDWLNQTGEISEWFCVGGGSLHLHGEIMRLRRLDIEQKYRERLGLVWNTVSNCSSNIIARRVEPSFIFALAWCIIVSKRNFLWFSRVVLAHVNYSRLIWNNMQPVGCGKGRARQMQLRVYLNPLFRIVST